ncbi:MAG: thioredoxin-dependent thiol peroxidase [Hyphomicrobiales bacterium]
MTKADNFNINEGDNAPDFTLPGDSGQTVTLSALKGQKIVLFFYPKDNTPGCTKEAIGFSENLDAFKATGTKIIGMSPDSATKHDKFKAKHDLTVTLAADEEKTTLEAYGVWVEKSMYGKKYMGVERSTFLINENGKIAKIWRKVKVSGHVDAVLETLKAL